MEYQLFLSNVKEKLEKELPCHVCIKDFQTVKNNGEKKRGFLFQKENGTISPIIYMEDYFDQYCQGAEINQVTDDLMEVYDEIRKIPDSVIEAESFQDYEKMKGKIVFRLISGKRNEDMLRTVPYYPYLDLAIVFYVLFAVQKYHAVSMLVTDEHLKLWKIDKRELLQCAYANTPKLLPAELSDIREVMREFFPEEKEKFNVSGQLYVLTNEQKNYGAAAMLYPSLLEKIGEEWQENFYILPSSIHEVLLVPESKSPDIRDMRMAVYSINRSDVVKEEWLSDSVYYYNCEKNEVLV